MTYLPSGKIDDGPLATDRPHTGKVYGFYRLKWLGMDDACSASRRSAYPGHADQHLPAGGRHLVGLPVGRRPRQFRATSRATANGDIVRAAS